MGVLRNILKLTVAAAWTALIFCGSPLAAQQNSNALHSERLPELMQELRQSDEASADRIVKEIRLEWDKSGSLVADFLLKRGRTAFEIKDYQAAIEHFTAVTDHAPEFAEAWVERARTYLEVQLIGPALSDLEMALTLNPDHFEALNGLAVILETTNQPQAAYEAYQLVRSIHPHHRAVTQALERLEPVVKGRKL